MERPSRSRRAKVGNKENVPPPGVDSQRPRPVKSKKRTNSVLADLPRASKAKKAKGARKELPPPPTLQGLPFDVLDHLLHFLDVESLTALSRTCTQFDQLINGRYLTSVRLPFSMDDPFMKEIQASEVIEKKPVLRILCRRFLDWQKAIAGRHQLDTHLSLLSLKKVREVDLFPGKILEAPINQFMIHQWSFSEDFEWIILNRLSSAGALRHISKLNIMLTNGTQGQYIEKIMAEMTNLLELNLFVAVSGR